MLVDFVVNAGEDSVRCIRAIFIRWMHRGISPQRVLGLQCGSVVDRTDIQAREEFACITWTASDPQRATDNGHFTAEFDKFAGQGTSYMSRTTTWKEHKTHYHMSLHRIFLQHHFF